MKEQVGCQLPKVKVVNDQIRLKAQPRNGVIEKADMELVGRDVGDSKHRARDDDQLLDHWSERRPKGHGDLAIRRHQ